MRGLRITLIALAVVLLCEASRVWAAQLADSVIIEEPASLTADPSNGTADGVSVREPILIADGSLPDDASGSVILQPTWPIVLIAASLIGMSMMAVKPR
jgi:hypothetical protein